MIKTSDFVNLGYSEHTMGGITINLEPDFILQMESTASGFISIDTDRGFDPVLGRNSLLLRRRLTRLKAVNQHRLNGIKHTLDRTIEQTRSRDLILTL